MGLRPVVDAAGGGRCVRSDPPVQSDTTSTFGVFAARHDTRTLGES